MENPLNPEHIPILKELVKGKKQVEIKIILKLEYELVRWRLKEMRSLAGANTNEEMCYLAGKYGWV